MTAPYLLPLADLHVATPGAVDAIAHFDGDFPEAPIFHPPLWDGSGWVWDYDWNDAPARGLTLDLRVSSIFDRLLRLCSMAVDMDVNHTPESLAREVLALAPQIAALRGGA